MENSGSEALLGNPQTSGVPGLLWHSRDPLHSHPALEATPSHPGVPGGG